MRCLTPWAIAAIAVVLAGSARGQPATQENADAEVEPWAEGVSEANQSRALADFASGNDEFSNGRYATAAPFYQRALELWDHPVFHYNLAVCLINLDRPLRAHEHIQAALKYGEAPFDNKSFAQARTYAKLLQGRLTELEVKCTVPAGARVSVDGEEWVTCPGSRSRWIVAGDHQIVGRKDGFSTHTETVSGRGGTHPTIDIALVRLTTPESVRLDRPLNRWLPYGVIAGGAALLVTAVPLGLSSEGKYDDYDRRFASECPNGCDPAALPADVRELRESGDSLRVTAIALGGAGAAIALGGIALALWNQPRPVESGTVSVTPTRSGFVLHGWF